MASQLLTQFQQLGVVSKGHFLLSSGQHSDEYWEKFRLFEWPRVTEQLCGEIAEHYRDQSLSAIVGPTTGGALMAQEVARQLDLRCILAEPVPQGGREVRRGFQIQTGERILIVDDILTTGLSLRETLGALEPFQPNIIGIEVLIDRSGGNAARQFSMPCRALLTVSARTYAPDDCPICQQGIPVVKPGSRGNKAN